MTRTIGSIRDTILMSVRLPVTPDRGYKVQSFRYGVGPWEDDCSGEWLDPAGTMGRRWQEGMTLAEATQRVADSERSRRTNAYIQPRRVVLFTHPSGVAE